MGVEIVQPNTCFRGCCSSESIPLCLPSSFYSLLSPIARGNINFLVIYLHISLQNFVISLFGVMSVQGRRALFMKLVWMGRKLLSRNPSCLLLKTLINSTRSCNSYGLHFYPSVFSFLWIYVQNLNGFVWNFKYDNIDNAAS